MKERLVIRNNMAVVGWIFCGAWVVSLVMFSWIFARDRGFDQLAPFMEAGILLWLWMGTVVLIAELMTKPRVRLVLDRRAVRLTLAWLIRCREETLPVDLLRELSLRHDRDSDGEPHYVLAFRAASGHEVVLSESPDRDQVEAVLRDIRANL